MEHWNWNQSGGMPSCGAEQTDRQVTTHNQTTRPGPGNPTLATLRTTITIHFLGQTKETPPNRYHGWLADARSFFFSPLSSHLFLFPSVCVYLCMSSYSTAQHRQVVSRKLLGPGPPPLPSASESQTKSLPPPSSLWDLTPCFNSCFDLRPENRLYIKYLAFF